MADAPQPPQPRPEDDDDVLDVELDEPTPGELPPAPAAAPPLEITLEDLAEPAAPADLFPAVTADQVAAAQPGVTVPCSCSSSGQAFEVRFEEREPGAFWAAETRPLAAPGGKDTGPTGAASLTSVPGTFHMGPEFACPYCRSAGLLLCNGCGAVLCLGGLGKQGELTCPVCRTTLRATSEAVSAAPSRTSGKGKFGKGR